MTEQYRIRRPDETEGDPDLEAVPLLRDAIGPFANKAEVVFDDPGSVKQEEWPRPTLVEIDVRVPGVFDWARRFAGFVQDHSLDRNETEMLILSHDFWIKKATGIYSSFEEETIETILEELVTRETPLIWNPDLVEIENNETITREWAGDALENILEELQTISGGEELYGATFDREFLWRPVSNESAPRAFTPGEFLNTEWDEDGKNAANRAIVRYGEGDDQAVVAENDRGRQRDLQEEIGADGPVDIPIQDSAPKITSERRARDKAKQLLDQRSELQSGEIETWDAFAVQPGQLARVRDPETDVDDEFRVAQIEYEWPSGSPPTQVTVADSELDTVDELVGLTDKVQQLDLQDADPDAPFLEAIVERVGAELTVTASVTAREFGDDRFTPGIGRGELGFGRDEPGLDVENVTQTSQEAAVATNRLVSAVRDGWRGDPPPVATTLRVGTGSDEPSRTDETLVEEIDTLRATITLASMSDVRWSGTIRFDEGQTLRELGLSNGELWSRATLLDAIDIPAQSPTDVSLRIDIDEDDEFLGTLNAGGSEALRDILADNNPALPAALRFVVDAGEDIDEDIEQFRTRGTGRIETTGRLNEVDAAGATVEAIAQIDGDGTALVTNDFSPIEVTGFDLEATQLLTISNS